MPALDELVLAAADRHRTAERQAPKFCMFSLADHKVQGHAQNFAADKPANLTTMPGLANNTLYGGPKGFFKQIHARSQASVIKKVSNTAATGSQMLIHEPLRLLDQG